MENNYIQMQPVVEEAFVQYGGAVLQSRALVDVRDCLKPSARQIFYCLYTDKFLHNKPYKKTLKAVGSGSRMYIHGNASMVGILMRSAQPFSMRYPLTIVKGNEGSLIKSGDWASERYTETKLSEVTEILFKDIDKNSIEDWRDNYDNTEQYPSVLPSKGFYNIVNGTMGIGIGMSSSIPAFNLREVNEALIRLLWNPNCDFEDIYCVPDFPTGAILLNESQVKESLRNGTGKSCIIRAVVEYDDKDRCFVVKEIPYGVYTNTICGQLEDIIESEDNPGIDRFNDLTGENANIKIYLRKTANPDKVLKFLNKNTSLQYHYSINMTMLDNGRFPKVFNWKEALQAHLTHEIEVYRRSYLFDLEKIEKRLNIVEGLLIALANIDEVIKTIKSSPTTAAARQALINNFQLNEAQAKAILDMKLSRLAHLEIEKLEKEKEDLLKEQNRIKEILSNKELLYKEIEKGYREVAEKFGDERRTKIMNMNFSNDEDDEPIEEKELYIYLTNEGNLYTNEVSTLYTQRRGGRGAKLKMGKNEYIITSQQSSNANILLAFSNKGKVYSLNLVDFPTSGRVNISEFFVLADGEQIVNIAPCGKVDKYKSVVFVTKNGLIKKTDFSEYKIKKSNGVIAIKLKDDDELISTMFVNSENIGFLTKQGYFLIIDIEKVNSIGRATTGVKAIKLSEGDEVVDARKIKQNCKEIVSITNNSYISRTNRSDFEVGTRATKGTKIQKVKDNGELTSFLPIDDKEELLIVSNKGTINIRLNEVTMTGRGALGNIAKKLLPNEYITNIM
jgi:DNA gyrase subunit A